MGDVIVGRDYWVRSLKRHDQREGDFWAKYRKMSRGSHGRSVLGRRKNKCKSSERFRRENPVKLQQSKPGTIQDEAEANGGDPLRKDVFILLDRLTVGILQMLINTFPEFL